ncbi:MAG TPA: hypothetical protein VFS39_18160 [Nitrospira sp.]|nr:hypothetical protein [Nitrospira sp.]
MSSFVWSSVLLLFTLASPVWGRDFSAERIVKTKTATVTAHVNAKEDRWRLEFARPQRGADVVIVRIDRNSSWLILSKRRQYAEVPIGEEHRLSLMEAMEGEQSRDFIGTQTLNGYPTELFEVTVAVDGGTRQYYRWVTKEERFPIKTVSKEGTWSEEYRRVLFTPQSSFLFELPRRLDPAAPSEPPAHDEAVSG